MILIYLPAGGSLVKCLLHDRRVIGSNSRQGLKMMSERTHLNLTIDHCDSNINEEETKL